MKCGQVREKLSCYLDGVMDEATLEAVEAHLMRCADCRKELEALRVTVSLTSCIGDVESPACLASVIKETIEQETAGSCAPYLAMFSEYIDGELSAKDKSDLEAHITICGSCEHELKIVKATVASVALAREIDPPAALRDRIAAATTGKRKIAALRHLRYLGRIFQNRRAVWAAGATAATVVLAAWILIPVGTKQKTTAKAVIPPLQVIARNSEGHTVVEASEPAVKLIETKAAPVQYNVTARELGEPADVHGIKSLSVRPSTKSGELVNKNPKLREGPVVIHSATTIASGSTDGNKSSFAATGVLIADAAKHDQDLAASPSDKQSTFTKIARRSAARAGNVSGYFEGMKLQSDQQNRQQAGDRLRVDVISAKF